MINDVIQPIIDDLSIEKYEYKVGYRSNDYYIPGYNPNKTYSDSIRGLSSLSTVHELEITDEESEKPEDTVDDMIDSDEQLFIFVNIGMFAVLTNVDKVKVGKICNPNRTYIITDFTNNKFITDFKKTKFDDKKIY